VSMFGFGGLLMVAAVSDRLLFHYRKTPGRGYEQVRNLRTPPWLARLHSTLELTGFLGFVATLIFLALQLR
jgi:hypothetical protein